MKNTISTLTIAALSLIAIPASANNWQSQLDQIKADQQRRAKCRAAEQVKQLAARMAEAQRKVDADNSGQRGSTAPVK